MNKKKILAAGLLLVSLTTQLKAQLVDMTDKFPRVEFGLRFMPTLSNFQMQTYEGGTVAGQATFGYGAGGVLGFNFTKHAGMQVEFLYNSLSQKFRDQDLDKQINVRYLSIPLLFSLNTGKQNRVNLNLVLGPQIGMNLGSEIVNTGSSGDIDTITFVLATKTTDFGFAYGGGIEFTLNELETIRLDLGFRGVYGLMNISDNSKPIADNSKYIIGMTKVRTQAIYIGFSFLF